MICFCFYQGKPGCICHEIKKDLGSMPLDYEDALTRLKNEMLRLGHPVVIRGQVIPKVQDDSHLEEHG